jgi:meso-butanediol dehydrogenase / (S,S)-butanediol dehydrogenase / diacetyl reductase
MAPRSAPGSRPGRLDGKVALITGTGGDQGRVAALRFAEEGALVVGCDLDAPANDETAELVRERGYEMAATAPVDLGDPDQVARWVDGAATRFGRIDVLYNNAAGPRFAPFSEMTLVDWDSTLRNELSLVFHACKAAWPHLVAAGGGSIVNTSSYTALDGQPAGSVAHAAAKGGVLGLTRALSVEGSPHGIRANSILPGLVDTAVTRRVVPPDRFEFIRSIAKLGRVATPEDIVACALYLASDESSIVTGTELVVGGGNILLGPQLDTLTPHSAAS